MKAWSSLVAQKVKELALSLLWVAWMSSLAWVQSKHKMIGLEILLEVPFAHSLESHNHPLTEEGTTAWGVPAVAQW